MNGKRAFFTPFDKTANVMDLWCRAARSVQTTHWHIGRTVRTGHAPSEKGAFGVNVLTVDQRIRLRNSPFNNTDQVIAKSSAPRFYCNTVYSQRKRTIADSGKLYIYTSDN